MIIQDNVSSNEINTFPVDWDEKLKESPPPTKDQKINRLYWDAISVLIPVIGLVRLIGYAIGKIAKVIILPSRYTPKKDRDEAQEIFDAFWKKNKDDTSARSFLGQNRIGHTEHQSARKNFKLEEHTVITPDGAALSVKLLRHQEATTETPTVIYFQGNGEFASAEPNPWFLQESIKRNTLCNFVFFDYREVGDSTGTFEAAKDLVVDGYSIVQWVRKALKTPDHEIHFYGKSLGGAVAAQTQALDPENLTGKHLNERSFASLDKMVKSILGSGCLGKLLAWVVHNQGHSADAAAAFQKLEKQEKLVVYHPNDRIIPLKASLHHAVQHHNTLELKPHRRDNIYTILSNKYHHNALLEWHEEATERMGHFLFGDPKPEILDPEEERRRQWEYDNET